MKKFEMYPAYSPQEVARKISTDGEHSPLVTIYLTTDISFEGQIIRVEKQGHEEVVLMQTSEASTPSLLYFLFTDIKAIKVHSPEMLSGVLSSGVKFRPENLTAPTKLGLKRRVEEFSIRLEIDWDGFNLNSRDELFNFDDLITALSDAIKKISSDELGVKSLASNKGIRLIYVSAASPLNFKKSDDKIIIEFNPLKGLGGHAVNFIKDSIERLI